MIRLKIKDFKLNVGDRVGIEAKLPTSLSATLASASDEWLSRDSSEPPSVELSGVIEIEPHMLSTKHVCLRLTGISEPAEIVLNGKTISTPDSRERIYVYNVKERLFPGYNTLVIRFLREGEGARARGIRLRATEPYDPAVESVELMAFDSAAISSVSITERHSEDGVTVGVTMGLIGCKDGVRAVATLVSPAGKMYYGGLSDGSGTITVNDPLLWWPRGMGVPNLYDLSVNLYHGDLAEDVCELKIGLRELGVTAEQGRPSLRVNGYPAFLKGARLMPETLDGSYRSEGETVRLVESAAEVGINALYVPPVGRAPSARLIDLCDKNGILLIYGVTSSADEPQLSDLVKREIVDGPRRIASHASTAAFYINGEGLSAADELFSALSAYCPNVKTLVAACEPYTELPCSLPEIKTLSETFAGDEANILSPSVEARTDGSLASMLAEIVAEYRFPEGTDELSYISQLLAADAITSRLAESRGRFGSYFAPRLNDGAPMLSPSTLDSPVRWKAAHYRLRRLYAPVSVLHRINGYKVSFTVYNDRTKEYSGSVTCRVVDRNGVELHRDSFECASLAPASSIELTELDLAEYIKGHERDRILVYSYGDGVTEHTATVFFTKSKYFRYKNPKIRAAVSGSGKRFDVTLYAEAFARSVRVSFENSEARFSDNFIDIVSAAPVRISVETTEAVSAERLLSEIRLLSMYDVGRGAWDGAKK